MTQDVKVVKKNVKALEIILYYISAMALPNFFLFNIYNQNRSEASIVFNHILILALVLAVASIVSLLVIRFLTQTYEGSLLIIFFMWISFWFFESLFANLPISNRASFLAIIAVTAICLCVLFRLLARKLQKARLVFSAVAGVVTLLFIFNAFPTIIDTLIFSDTTRGGGGSVGVYNIRREFNVDASLPSPDIYWLHMDGMISFTSMERMFNDAQLELRQQLEERGFIINEDASFSALDTSIGVPALLSPDFYDSYLHELFMESRPLLRGYRGQIIYDTIERDGISLIDEIAPYHELFHGFLQAGYTAVMIAPVSPYVYVPIDRFYRLCLWTDEADAYPLTIIESSVYAHFLQNALELVELLSLMTPIPYRFVSTIRESGFEWQAIPEHTEMVDYLTADTLNLRHERQIYRRLIDSFSIQEPKLLYLTIEFAHGNRWHWHDADLSGHGAGAERLDLYPLAHEYAANVMIRMIDMILEQNPNAIIVLQADHGFHLGSTQRALLEQGYSVEEVTYLNDSTLSAVRIPEQYGGLDKPIAPLNITRELINRFVGINYELRFD